MTAADLVGSLLLIFSFVSMVTLTIMCLCLDFIFAHVFDLHLFLSHLGVFFLSLSYISRKFIKKLCNTGYNFRDQILQLIRVRGIIKCWNQLNMMIFFFSKSVLEILIENIDTREAVTGAIIRTSSNISRQQHFSISNKGNNSCLLLT